MCSKRVCLVGDYVYAAVEAFSKKDVENPRKRVRDCGAGCEGWIPARVKNRNVRAIYDALTEEDRQWRKNANQWRGEESLV